ncbi:MAG: twin-arginine translocation pathway signal, partial [Marinosulfonomonas sp.]|nr:twin-arginine translocation pathway signal [Marinosulfonomonas sp.]
AGGAIAGGKVYGDWPGLAEAELYDRRDLMPTGDVRAVAAWAMRDMFGLDRSVLERSVFPNLDMGINPGIIL